MTEIFKKRDRRRKQSKYVCGDKIKSEDVNFDPLTYASHANKLGEALMKPINARIGPLQGFKKLAEYQTFGQRISFEDFGITSADLDKMVEEYFKNYSFEISDFDLENKEFTFRYVKKLDNK